MDKKIKLAETVFLVDTAYLNFMLVNLKGFLENQVNRKLSDISMADLFTYLALDAGLKEGEKVIQIILVADDSSSRIKFAIPSDLKKDLDGVAFDSSLGEFAFASAFTEGMVSREDLFLDILNIVTESKDVKELIVLSFDDEYGGKVFEKLNDKDLDKTVTQFRMREPEKEVNYKWDMLVFPLMKAFGIEGSEI